MKGRTLNPVVRNENSNISQYNPKSTVKCPIRRLICDYCGEKNCSRVDKLVKICYNYLLGKLVVKLFLSYTYRLESKPFGTAFLYIRKRGKRIMGFAKNDYIMCQERGYGHCDRYVCRDCIGNKALKEYISNKGIMAYCNYCRQRRKVVTVENLLEPIMSGINFQYENADNYYFDGETPTSVTTYELIHYELSDELQITSEELLDDISNTIDDISWCEVNPYEEKEYESEIYSWHSFCKLVKHSVRYLFYNSKNVVEEYDLSNPVNILETVEEYVKGLKLIRRLSQKTKVYRGRTHTDENQYIQASDFGPPPVTKAKANRMSAEGISMFYAAFDENTAIKEIYNSDEYATIAQFRLSRHLTVIDLTKLNTMSLPSIFDEERRQQRSSVIFLKEFAKEISRKVEEYPSIEYVPTQIVTEYFRYVFNSDKYGAIDGIVYNSAQNPGGCCVALFMSESDYLDDGKSMVDKHSFKYQQYKKQFTEIENC